MRLFNLIGLDCYSSILSLNELMFVIKSKGVFIYNVHYVENELYFESSVSNYYKLSSCDGINYIGTLGILGYIRRFFYVKRNWIVVMSCIISIWLYSNTIWDVFIVGEEDRLIEHLRESMIENNVWEFSLFVSDIELSDLELRLKSEFFDEIEWINLVRKGDSILVQFMPRESAIREEWGYEPLVARKEAVVTYFDVLSGRKLVGINDYVKSGDILVSPTFLDSFGKEKKTFVKGKVYGNTLCIIEKDLVWPYEFEATKPIAFFRLLFSIRGEIAQELGEDERILSENILQFSEQEGTIMMKVQYTLYEDITRP